MAEGKLLFHMHRQVGWNLEARRREQNYQQAAGKTVLVVIVHSVLVVIGNQL